MKKIIIFFVFISFIAKNEIYAQKNTTIKWSTPSKLPYRNSMTDIIGGDGEHTYLSIGMSGVGVKLEKYDNNLKLIYSNELEIPKKNKDKLDYEAIILLNKQPILLTSFFDKKSQTSYFFAYPIDEKGKVESKFKLLVSKKSENKKPIVFDYELSKDSTKLLVYNTPAYKKYQNESFSYKVYDGTLNLIWEKDIKLPFRDKFFEVHNYLVDNVGNVHMLAKILPDPKGDKKEKGTQADKFVVLSYKYKKDELIQYQAKINNKWIVDMHYDVNETTKEITVSGFYSNDKKITSVDGLFTMSIDMKLGEAKKTAFKKFEKDFLAEIIGERKAKKEKGIQNFKIRKVYARKNGGVYFLAEEEYIEIITSVDSKGNTTTRIVYHYDKIIAASINKDGEIEWARVIQKKSHDGAKGYYLSYAPLFNAETDELNIVFNDNPKNIELIKKDKVAADINTKKAMVTLVNINSEGNLKRIPLFNNKELKKTRLRPKINTQISNNELLIFGIQGKNYQMGKIIF